MATKNLTINGTPQATIRIDTDEQAGGGWVTVYNCPFADINKLIGMLEAVKEDMRIGKPVTPPTVNNAIAKTEPSARYEDAPKMPAASKKRTKMITITNVQQRNMLHSGLSVMELLPDNWAADIMESKGAQTRSIRIYGISPELTRLDETTRQIVRFHRAFDVTFQEGMTAIYQKAKPGSSGKSLKGKIVGITKLHVMIERSSESLRRLSIREFIELNWK